MKNLAYLALGLLLFTSCSSSEYRQSALDTLLKQHDKDKNLSVILYDMEKEGSFSPTYKHQYKVITEGSGVGADTIPKESLTQWIEVSDDEFDAYENNMGMEIATKDAGKIKKIVAPPGYSKYVGNQRYGHWQTNSSGQSFWAFYGQYAFMRSMLGLGMNPIYRSGYSTYRTSYYGRKPYYGARNSTGGYRYGTYSSSMSGSGRRYTSSSSYTGMSSTQRSSRSSGSYSARSGKRSTSGSRSGSSSRSRSSSRGGK